MTNTVLPAAFIRNMYAAGLPKSDAHILVAFSGGADSTALLSMVHTLSFKQRVPFSVSAVHIHHGIRGAEADRDADFCTAFCRERSIPITVYHINVPGMAEISGRSLEEEAREQRYGCLARHIENNGNVTHLLTAHHADDQTETVLFRLLRGTSPAGLTGIPLTRILDTDAGKIPLVRPLLNMTKQDILAYCTENGISYVTDSTNAVLDCSRNLLRNIILPAAKEINPSFARALLRLSDDLRTDLDYFTQAVDDFCNTYFQRGKAGELAVPIAALCTQHRALSSRILARMYREADIPVPCTNRHIDAMLSILTTTKPAEVCLPAGYVFSVSPDSGYCTLNTSPSTPEPLHCKPIPLSPGIPVPLWNGAMCLFSENSPESEKKVRDLKNIYKFFISTHINSDKLLDSVFLRPRSTTAKDVYRCGGCDKTVRDALSSHRVPRYMRGDIPLFCDGGGILWVPFCGIRDDVNPRFTEGSRIADFYYFYSDERTFSQ